MPDKRDIAPVAQQVMILVDMSRTLQLMGGDVVLSIYDIDHPMAEAFFGDIFDDVQAQAQRLQRTFDFFAPTSELSNLNRKRELTVSSELSEVIKKGLSYSEQAGGRYDITLGKRIMARKQGKPLPESACSFRDVEIEGRRVRLLHPDVRIDLGSIAKGYAADRLVEYMKGLGIASGFVNARGDMKVFGGRTETVAIQHPREKGRTINPFTLKDSSVATSGDYCQFYGSYESSHLVGESDLCSVTVVGESLTDADAIASCVFLLGSDGACRFLKNHRQMKAFAMDRDLNEYSFNGFREILVNGGEDGG